MKKHIILFSEKKATIERWREYLAGKYELSCRGALVSLYGEIDELKRGLILYDYDSKKENIFELLEYVKSKGYDFYIFALNSKPDYYEGIELLRRGARGYANSYISRENLAQAVTGVKSGNIWVYPEFIQAMIKNIKTQNIEKQDLRSILSDREFEIAKMASMGFSNKEISQSANIAENTVKAHLGSAYEKLGVKSRLSLALLFKNGQINT